MGFSSEDQLLIYCSRVIINEDINIGVINLLEQEIDWNYILEASVNHGVAPLFYHGLQQVVQYEPQSETRIPIQVLQSLDNLYQISQKRNKRLYATIGEIIGEFDQAGIQVMGLKDIHLAKDIYPDAGLRPMGDIDLLIHRNDYDKASNCLDKLGFKQEPPQKNDYTMKYAWGHHFRRSEDNVWVDLQWNLMQIEWDLYGEGNFDFEIQRMWAGAKKHLIGEFQILVPKIEDMLFHLCLHLEGHHFAELILLCDINELLVKNGQKIDWEYLIGITKKYDAESSVYYPLLLTQALFQTQVPSKGLDRIRPLYQKTSLLNALFGNLTRLHSELDNVQNLIHPPKNVMEKNETIVREQAVSAMNFYREIDQLIREFQTGENGYCFIEGNLSERLLADRSLPPFGDLHLLILNNDLPKLKKAFISRGFEEVNKEKPELLRRSLSIFSKDPALNGKPLQIAIHCTHSHDWKKIFHTSNTASSKQVAIKLLRNHIFGQDKTLDFQIRILVVSMTFEQALAYFYYKTGTADTDLLFRIASLLPFHNKPLPILDANIIGEFAKMPTTGEAIIAGASLARDIFDTSHKKEPLVIGKTKPIHVLKWARFGPDSGTLYSYLKRPFFFVLCIFSLDSLKNKLRYLKKTFKGSNGERSIFVSVFLDMCVGFCRLLRGGQSSDSGQAFWLEP